MNYESVNLSISLLGGNKRRRPYYITDSHDESQGISDRKMKNHMAPAAYPTGFFSHLQ
jgi:hypothetical protein